MEDTCAPATSKDSSVSSSSKSSLFVKSEQAVKSESASSTSTVLSSIDSDEEEPLVLPFDTVMFSEEPTTRIHSLKKSPFITASSLREHFDEVDVKTVRRLEDTVKDLNKRGPTFARNITRYAMEDCPEIPLRKQSDIDARTKSKGKPKQRVSRLRGEALWLYLQDSKEKQRQNHMLRRTAKSKKCQVRTPSTEKIINNNKSSDINIKLLFQENIELERLWRASIHLKTGNHEAIKKMKLSLEELEKAKRTFHASFFTVDKSTVCKCTKITCKHFYQRIIVDARIANAHLQNPAPMELFTLDALFSCFARCKQKALQLQHEHSERMKSNPQLQRKSFSILTIDADLRHYFHQIPLPRKLRAAMAIHLGIHRAKNGRRKDRVVFPTTWPMGTSPAPGIGQALTWSLLLHDLETDLDKRRGLGILWEGNFDVQIPWLPLSDGGGVFVLIDNIFVVTSDSKLATAWQQRIRTAAAEFNAELKDDEVNFNRLSATGGSVEFNGIHFTFHGRRPKRPIKQVEWLEDNSIKKKSISYRDLAAIVGQCVWTYRVLGERLYNKSHFRAISRQSFPSPRESWGSITSISGDTLVSLRALYKECRNEEKVVDYLLVQPCRTFVFAATDASYSAAAGARTGFVYSKVHSVEEYSVSVTESRSQTLYQQQQQVTDTKYESPVNRNKSQIAIEELRAVVELVSNLRNRFGNSMPDLIILGIDSTHAKGMITKNLARTSAACDLLDKLYEMLGGSRLYLLYVPSADNPADALTRNDVKWSEEKWCNLKTRMRKLLPVAAERFNKFERLVEAAPNGGSRRQRYDQ